MNETKKIGVLWIEDAAIDYLATLASQVYMDGGYDLRVATDASEAYRLLLANEFDVVVFDIRIPPGDDERWIQLWWEHGGNKIDAQLGLHLLRTVLGNDKARIPLDENKNQLDPSTIAVLSVEPDHKEGLERLGVRVYVVKKSRLSNSILLDIIKKVLKQKTG